MSSASHSEIDARYRYACEIARAAASRALSWYQQRQKLVVEHKRDLQDVVSEADRNVEELIKSLIAERYPEDAVLGEESGGETGEARILWVIDPIDGTACFVNGLHNWCVSLAIVCEGEPVVGVVCDPNHQELFHARKGQAPGLMRPGLRFIRPVTSTKGCWASVIPAGCREKRLRSLSMRYSNKAGCSFASAPVP